MALKVFLSVSVVAETIPLLNLFSSSGTTPGLATGTFYPPLLRLASSSGAVCRAISVPQLWRILDWSDVT
jgi:hypothetical protein